MPFNEKQKFIKQNFEYHARIAAHAIASKNRWSEREMDIIYMAIMSYLDTAFERKKIEIKLCSEWDHEEEEFQKNMKNEAIKQGDWDGVSEFNH